jgi:hypothetical protein
LGIPALVWRDKRVVVEYNSQRAKVRRDCEPISPCLIGHYLPADGTVEKAIFSITCTTCRTRLAVRTEAAIGQILECPKCRSMVQITPPPGWQPAIVVPPEPVVSGPPPLDHVAAAATMLDLGPTGTTFFGEIIGQHIFMTAVIGVVLVNLCLLGWWLLRLAWPAPATGAVDRPVATVKEPARDQAVSSGSQSKGVSVPHSLPAAPAATPPVTPPEAKQPKLTKADPRPAATNPAKTPAIEQKTDEREEAKQAKQPETKKLPPPPVDVVARMADALPGIELTDVPLIRAIELLSTMSTVPITLDADAMRQLGASPRDRISLRLDSTTIGKALQAVAAKRGLAAAVENGQVILTLPAEQRETLRTVPYTVSDLTGADKAAVVEFGALVRRLVAPESWQSVGGRGAAEAKDRVLTVTQTRDVHWQVLVFCEKLRNARNKPLRSHDRPELFALTTRTSQAREMLDRLVTVNYHEPAPLAKILDFLAKASDGDILVDHAALAAAETSDRVETSLTVQKRPLGAVLDELLRPLGLAYRVVGSNAIQVTSAEAADERLELEFYPVGPRLAKEDSPRPLAGEGQAVRAAKLIERLKAQVAASTWTDAGGSGEVYFDAPSQCLIVLQSQHVQAEIERLLAAKGGGEKIKAE